MVPANRLVLVGVVIGSVFVYPVAAPVWAGLCFQCGGNSATVGDGIVFDELRLGEPVKPEGPAITEVRSFTPTGPTNGTPVSLEVEGDRLSAFTMDGAHQSVPVTGVVMTLKMRDGRAYKVQLQSEQFETMRFWAAPQDPLASYLFKVMKVSRKKNAHPVPAGKPYPADDGPECYGRPEAECFDAFLCTHKFPEPALNDLKGQEHTALVFTGDHYGAKHTVSKQAKGTFNLACIGTASAKMHLLRHTTAGTPPGGKTTTSLEQRTAMLRAMTADYCGNGRPWTQDGTPLWWTDQGQTFPLSIQPGFPAKTPNLFFNQHIEAVWGGNGKLLCLNNPRRTPGTVDPETCEAPAVSRAMVTSGAAACPRMARLPRCSDFPWSNQGPNPWAEPPLLPGTTPPGKRLPDAYVVTVNAPGKANYCNNPRRK